MKDHQYFAYIVCSRSGTPCIGMTNSIYRRLQHKRGVRAQSPIRSV